MQNNTERNRKTAPIVCALAVVAFFALILAMIVYPLLGENFGDAIAAAFLGVYALIIVAVIVGVLLALRQRLREIKGGEEEDAKQY